MMFVRMNKILWKSQANGPGVRAVFFFQGCDFKCENCINPQTHNKKAGFQVKTENIVKNLKRNNNQIEGITISGGEPFLQPKSLLDIVRTTFKLNLGVIISTGYNYDELLQNIASIEDILPYVDLLITGRFHHKLNTVNGYRGSQNKKYIFLTERYSREDMEYVPQMEIIFSGSEIKVTGIKIKEFFPWSGF